MAKKRRLGQVDPAVLAIVSEGSSRQARRQKKQTVGQRSKVTLRIDPATRRIIEAVARNESTSQAGVVDLFVAEAVRRYIADEIQFDQHTRESRSPRQMWVVDVVELDVLARELEDFLLT